MSCVLCVVRIHALYFLVKIEAMKDLSKSPNKKTSPQPIRKVGKRDIIIWTEERDLCLLDVCLVNGIHKKRPNGKEYNSAQLKEKWIQIQTEFFMQDVNKGLEKPPTTRKIRDRYSSLLKNVCAKNGWGEKGGTPQNLSKEDGDLGAVDAKVRTILMEMEVIVEESEEEKAMNADKKLRNDLEKTEAAIWENRHRNPIKVKNADGELQDRSDAKKARKETLEDQVFKVLLKTSSMDEKAVEKLMWTYIVSENIDSLKFLELCSISNVPENEDTREKVEGLTIKVLVNMFCSPTQKFRPTQIKGRISKPQLVSRQQTLIRFILVYLCSWS